MWDEIGGFDVYLGMIWHRMGTPTGDHRSGTEAEYRLVEGFRKETGRPEILFYQKTADPPFKELDADQFAAARDFSSEIDKAGLMQRFKDLRALEEQLHDHLPKAIKAARPELFREEAIEEPLIELQPHFAHPYPLQPNFTGRVEERQMLTEWLTGETQPPLLALVAFGGMGKSALAWAWLQRDVLGLPLPGAADDEPDDADALRVPEDARPEAVFWWSFYERDSTFDGFVNAAFAYANGGAGDPGSTREKMEALVNILRERRLLLVLDGFERLLRQYARMDAVYQKDDVEDLPAQDRECADPSAAAFLRRLAGGAFASRILFTTRLFPSELERDEQPLANCRREDLDNFEPADAVAFLRAEGVKGNRSEIEAACRPYGFQPLALRLLAGVVVHDKRTPGDIKAAERHGLLKDPKGEPLRKMLETAYNALDKGKRGLLSRMSAFRSTVDYDTALIVNEYKNEGDFDAALDELTERGLLFLDADRARYDLHPLVRTYAYKRLSERQRKAVHERLVEYFEPLAADVPEKGASLEQLTPVIELYHHTVGAGRYQEAALLYQARITRFLFFVFGAYQMEIELLRALFTEDNRSSLLADEGAESWVSHTLANSHAFSGQCRRAVELYDASIAISEKQENMEGLGISLGAVASVCFTKLGRLADAERNHRRRIEIFADLGDDFQKAVGRVEVGHLLAYQGDFTAASSELGESTSYWKETGYGIGLGLAVSYGSFARFLAAEYQAALDSARRARKLTELPKDVIRAEWLIGATLIALGEEDKLGEAKEHLHEALTRCRRINLVELEPDILLSLAGWHEASGHPTEAREHAVEALAIADRCEYRLNQADIHNFLAALDMEEAERESDTQKRRAAIEHATKGYGYAWCDGPPHCYKPALEEAERLCAELGVKPPELEPTPEG